MISITRCSTAAGTYDSQPWQQKIVAQVSKEIQTRVDWIGVDWAKEPQSGNGPPAKSARVLDYACGPGMVSRVSMMELSGITTRSSVENR